MEKETKGKNVQLMMVVDQVQINDSLSTYSETYHLKPVNKEFEKRISIKVSGGNDIYVILDKLGIPRKKGDNVLIEIGAKIIQSKLITDEETEESKE